MIKLKYIFLREYKNANLFIQQHMHDCFEFVYYLNANGQCNLIKNDIVHPEIKELNIFYSNSFNYGNNYQFDFSPNSYSIIEPFTIHSEQHRQKANLIAFGFYLDDKISNDVKSFFSADKHNAILPFIDQIINEYKNKFYNYENVICSTIMQLLTTIIRKNKNQLNTNDEIADVKNYIDEYFTTDISIADLAKLSCYSEDHFSLKFKSIYHTSPKNYIIDKRMELAKKLITSTSLSLSEIALRCGYKEYVQFSLIFKKKVGVSPKKYLMSFSNPNIKYSGL